MKIIDTWYTSYDIMKLFLFNILKNTINLYTTQMRTIRTALLSKNQFISFEKNSVLYFSFYYTFIIC